MAKKETAASAPKNIPSHRGGVGVIPRSIFDELLANGCERIRQGKEIDPFPVVKIFDSDGAAIWLLTEISPARPEIAFGLCDLGQGCPELGYVDLSELASVRTRLGLRLEIDRYFRPTRPVSEYADDARRKGKIVA
jgi:hypothetical protein